MLLVLPVLHGCSRLRPPGVASKPDRVQPAATRPSTGIRLIEPAPRMRYGPIRVDLRSPVRIGRPVRIEITAPVNISTTTGQLTVGVPQLGGIAFKARYGVSRPVPLDLDPYLCWRGAGASGTAIRRSVTVVFPVPGVYMVNVALDSDDPGLDSLGSIQDVRTDYPFVYVTARGGRLFRSYYELLRDSVAMWTLDPVRKYESGPAAAVNVPPPPEQPGCRRPRATGGAAADSATDAWNRVSTLPDPHPHLGLGYDFSRSALAPGGSDRSGRSYGLRIRVGSATRDALIAPAPPGVFDQYRYQQGRPLTESIPQLDTIGTLPVSVTVTDVVNRISGDTLARATVELRLRPFWSWGIMAIIARARPAPEPSTEIRAAVPVRGSDSLFVSVRGESRGRALHAR